MRTTNSSRSRFRLPHWGWLVLATVVLVAGAVALSVWLPYRRERQSVEAIQSRGGSVSWYGEPKGPRLLRRLIGDEWMVVFDRTDRVELTYRQITDGDLIPLAGLKELWILDFTESTIPQCEISR